MINKILIFLLFLNFTYTSFSQISESVTKMTELYLDYNKLIKNSDLEENYITFKVSMRFKTDTIVEDNPMEFILNENRNKILSKYNNELVSNLPEHLTYIDEEYNVKSYVYVRKLKIIYKRNKMKGKLLIDVRIYY